jgi:hypothetical protein
MTVLHSFFKYLNSILCVYHIVFIHSSAGGHVGLFPCLGYYEQCCSQHGRAKSLPSLISLPLDVDLVVELLDHMLVLFLTFWGTSILFSMVSVLIYISTNPVQGFLSFHILASSCCLWYFWKFVWNIVSIPLFQF